MNENLIMTLALAGYLSTLVLVSYVSAMLRKLGMKNKSKKLD